MGLYIQDNRDCTGMVQGLYLQGLYMDEGGGRGMCRPVEDWEGASAPACVREF